MLNDAVVLEAQLRIIVVIALESVIVGGSDRWLVSFKAGEFSSELVSVRIRNPISGNSVAEAKFRLGQLTSHE